MALDNPIEKFATKPTITIQHNETIGYTIREMLKHRFRRFPVVNEENQPVGMITTTDIIGSFHEESSADFLKLEVNEIMTNKIVITQSDDTLRQTIKLLYNIGISGVPVVKDSKIIGIFTEKDVLLIDEIWKEVPDTTVSSEEGIGRPITDQTIATSDFTFWQVADLLTNLAQRQLIVRESETNTYLGIVTHMSLLRSLVNIVTLGQEDSLSQLQTLKVANLSLVPLFQRASPTVVSSCRIWMNSRGIEGFPLFFKGKPAKLITEKDLVGYLTLQLDSKA